MQIAPPPYRATFVALAALVVAACAGDAEPHRAPRANLERRIDLVARLDAEGRRSGLPRGARITYHGVATGLRRVVTLAEGAAVTWPDLPVHPGASVHLAVQPSAGEATFELATLDGVSLAGGTVGATGQQLEVPLPRDRERVGLRLACASGDLLASDLELRSEGRPHAAADGERRRTLAVADLMPGLRATDGSTIQRVDDMARKYPLPRLDTVEEVAVVELPFAGVTEPCAKGAEDVVLDLYLLPPEPATTPGVARVRLEGASGSPLVAAEVEVGEKARRLRRVVALEPGDAGGPLALRLEGPEGMRALVLRIKLEKQERIARTVATPERPNLLLVLVDTLGARHLELYGYERETAPRLTALAAEGILYERCYAPSPWTWPSTASLLTGLYPVDHGVIDYVETYLSGALDTLAERLTDEGFTCAAFSASPLICIGRNFDQGFELFREDFYAPTSVLVEHVGDFLDERGDDRWFAYVHSLDPHLPYHPAEPHASAFGDGVVPDWSLLERAQQGEAVDVPDDLERSARDLYDGEIRAWDEALGRLLDDLAARGLDDRTVVVVTADHGEAFGEHGRYGHGSDLFDETIHVPLVIAAPRTPGPIRIPEPVSLVDVKPTVLAALGIGRARGALPPFGRADDSRILFASTRIAVRGEGNEERVSVFSARSGGWKYVTSTVDGPTGRLYDLSNDPSETNDLAQDGELDERGERLRAAIGTWLREGRHVQAEEAKDAIDDDTLRLLQSLGYVDGDG